MAESVVLIRIEKLLLEQLAVSKNIQSLLEKGGIGVKADKEKVYWGPDPNYVPPGANSPDKRTLDNHTVKWDTVTGKRPSIL